MLNIYVVFAHGQRGVQRLNTQLCLFIASQHSPAVTFSKLELFSVSLIVNVSQLRLCNDFLSDWSKTIQVNIKVGHHPHIRLLGPKGVAKSRTAYDDSLPQVALRYGHISCLFNSMFVFLQWQSLIQDLQAEEEHPRRFPSVWTAETRRGNTGQWEPEAGCDAAWGRRSQWVDCCQQSVDEHNTLIHES